MDSRPNSIQELFNFLENRQSLKDKIFINCKKLTIIFSDHYKIDIELIYGRGFITNINDIFYCEIEEQDIVNFLIDIAENNWFVVERKQTDFLHKQKFNFISEKNFLKQKAKLLKKSGIKIFTRKELIFNS